jgi:hypothetical protein
MLDLILPLDRLKSLVLAADARFGPTDYANDHIWELSQSSGDPAALDLRTTFGLRARSFRIFPQFSEAGQSKLNPSEFETAPVIHQVYVNFALITFAPFAGIDVTCEVWVPDSHSLAIRYTIRNNGVTNRNLHFEVISLLSPGSEGHRMVNLEVQGTNVLAGETAGLHPVIFQTGGGKVLEGPLPALALDASLLPGTYYQTTIAQAALASPEASFDLARQIAARTWDAEKARIELANADQIQIQTGNQGWNQLFAIAQQTAHRFLVGPSEHLPHASFVFSRRQDQGYSPRGDGTDYTHLWNGQTPLSTHYLCSLLFPGSLETGKDLVRNFLAVQDPDTGFIDWKPGLAGQRSLLLATPVIASLVWEIYTLDADRSFLQETFQPLLDFVRSWFSLRQDQDGDGVPEWDHPAQLEFEDHPIFGNSHQYSLGADISAAESPALCALLYRECRAMIQIAETIDRLEVIPGLAAYAENVRAAVESSWDEKSGIYHFWDRDTHLTLPGDLLGQLEGNGSLPIRSTFKAPTRLVLKIDASSGVPPRPLITIYGRDPQGNVVERIILPERWQWLLEYGSVTTNDLFSAVDSLKIQGLESNDTLQVSSYDFMVEDLSLILPLYARIPSHARGAVCLEKTVLNAERFWMPFGLPACPGEPTARTAASSSDVLMIWNLMIGTAMVDYGRRARAAQLFTHLMKGVQSAVEVGGAFWERYSANDGTGHGEPNTLDGLPPLGLFLHVLGVRILSPWKVELEGQNPFPWPVRLSFRGLTVDRRNDKTIITFPDGQVLTVDDPSPCSISVE